MYQISPLNHPLMFDHSSASNTAPGEMGKVEFLQMLVAQLRHQDPLSPMESQQFASQLAEFSSLEELSSIDDSVTAGVDVDMMLTQAINNTLATTLIGREVIAYGDNVQLVNGSDPDLYFELQNPAENVEISIFDDKGELVRTINATSMSAGQHSLKWDGDNQQGEKLPEGSYTFSVSATDVDGNPIESYTIMRGIVNSVKYLNGSATLLVNGREIPFSEVLEIG